MRGELRQRQRWIGGQRLAGLGDQPKLRRGQWPTGQIPYATALDLRDLHRDLERELGSLITRFGAEHPAVQHGNCRRERQLRLTGRALLPEQVSEGCRVENDGGAIVPAGGGMSEPLLLPRTLQVGSRGAKNLLTPIDPARKAPRRTSTTAVDWQTAGSPTGPRG